MLTKSILQRSWLNIWKMYVFEGDWHPWNLPDTRVCDQSRSALLFGRSSSDDKTVSKRGSSKVSYLLLAAVCRPDALPRTSHRETATSWTVRRPGAAGVAARASDAASRVVGGRRGRAPRDIVIVIIVVTRRRGKKGVHDVHGVRSRSFRSYYRTHSLSSVFGSGSSVKIFLISDTPKKWWFTSPRSGPNVFSEFYTRVRLVWFTPIAIVVSSSARLTWAIRGTREPQFYDSGAPPAYSRLLFCFFSFLEIVISVRISR